MDEITVLHRLFGQGSVIDRTDRTLTVRFAIGEKKFVYPDAFREFLQYEDDARQAEVNALLAENDRQNEERTRRAELAHQLLLIQKRGREKREAAEKRKGTKRRSATAEKKKATP